MGEPAPSSASFNDPAGSKKVFEGLPMSARNGMNWSEVPRPGPPDLGTRPVNLYVLRDFGLEGNCQQPDRRPSGPGRERANE